jgi:hypothetical protein
MRFGEVMPWRNRFGRIERRGAVLLLLLGVALGVRPGVATPQPPSVQASEDRAIVKVEGNSLTVRLNQVPLREALQDIARQTGLRIIVNSARDDRLSLAFAKLPVEEGLRQLIGRDNFIFLYTPTRELKEVRVYASSQLAEPPPSLPPPLAVTAPQEAGVHQSMRSDPEPATRLASAIMLAGTNEAEKGLGIVLELLLRRETEPEIRKSALGALTLFGDVPVDQVTQVAIFDPEPTLRSAAMELLSQQVVHDPIAHAMLRQVAEGALDETVREEAQAPFHSAGFCGTSIWRKKAQTIFHPAGISLGQAPSDTVACD